MNLRVPICRKPKCLCLCEWYGFTGGFSVQCAKHNRAANVKSRARYAKRKAARDPQLLLTWEMTSLTTGETQKFEQRAP